MTQDVTLSSALRNNLQSLKFVARQIDEVTLRLATGLDVNSALQDPQNFFTALSLGDRSTDLQRTLDNLGGDLRTIEVANNALENLSSLATRAQDIAREADKLTNDPVTIITLEGDTDIGGVADISTIEGIDVGDRLQLATRTPDEYRIAGLLPTITVTAGMSPQDFADQINIVSAGSVLLNVEASISDQKLVLTTQDDNAILYGNFLDAGVNANPEFANALGFGEFVNTFQSGFTAPVDVTEFTIAPNNQIDSYTLVNSTTGEIAEETDRITDVETSSGGIVTFGQNDAVFDNVRVEVNGNNFVNIAVTSSIGQFVDAINNDPDVSQFIRADFLAGVITLTKINDDLEDIQFRLTSNEAATILNLGFSYNGLIQVNPRDDNSATRLLGGALDLANLQALEAEFEKITNEINGFAEDASFRGINLLNGEDLVSFFNEDQTTSLVTEGFDITAFELGINQANFATKNGTQSAIEKTTNALATLEEASRRLSLNTGVLQLRTDFINETTIVLDGASRDLTIADQNEEGANLLALQTRQALGTTSLSLASQSQQEVLRLF